jgi:hypothetical protein
MDDVRAQRTRQFSDVPIGGEQCPIDWPHTITGIYKVRCNLFHGQKAAHSEMDRHIVAAAFRTLVFFMREAEYL